MVLPKSFTTVTTFSKILALILFIALPIITFYIGASYQKDTKYITTEKTQVIDTSSPVSMTPSMILPTSFPLTQLDTTNWNQFTSPVYNYSFSYPDDYFITNESKDGQGEEGNYFIQLRSREDIPVYGATPADLEVWFIVELASRAATLESITNDKQNNLPYAEQYNLTRTTIDGTPAVRWRTTGPGGPSRRKKVGNRYVEEKSIEEVIKFLYQNREYTIIKFPADTSRQNEFEEIISTIKL